MSHECPIPIPEQTLSPAGKATIATRKAAVYGRSFWLAYLGLVLLMVGYGLLYRYADFIFFLGGTEYHIGWIVGIGMVGSLAMRLFLGVWIDRYGPRLIWTVSLALVSASCFGHLAVSNHAGFLIFLLRITFACGIAGIFGSSITFASNSVPNNRVAELVGMLGTGSYVGLMVGSFLGDFLYGTSQVEKWQVQGMFAGAGILAALAIPFVWAAMSDLSAPTKKRRPSMFRLLLRYHPGFIIVVGMVTGLGLQLPEVFLRAFAITLDIPSISFFFITYAICTILTRILFLRITSRVDLKPAILCGLVCLAASTMSFLLVHSSWQLLIPGIGFGITQAVLAPSVIAVANTGFPPRFRGLGSTMILAAFDCGCFIGSPAAGLVLHYAGRAGLPSYPILFSSMAFLVLFVGGCYLLVPARQTGRRPLVRTISANIADSRKSIDLSLPEAYHPAVPCHCRCQETLSVDACANASQFDLQ